MKKYLAILLTMMLLLSWTWNVSAAEVTAGATENDGVITVSGTVTNAVSGQKVTVLVVEDGATLGSLSASDIVYMNQVTPNGSGAYTLTFTMPVAKRTGTYDVYVGGTAVGTPDDTSFTFPTEEPTAAPVAPTVGMGSANPAANGANAFYYVMTITLNDGVTTGFTVKHYPTDMATDVENDPTLAETQNFNIANISGVNVKLISALKGIPNTEANREITTTATLTFTLGGNTDSITQTGYTSLNDTRNQ